MIEIIAEQTYHITGRGQCIVFSMQTNNLTQSTLPKQGEKITWKGATYVVKHYESSMINENPPTLKDMVSMFIRSTDEHPTD
jgi:hypothetical protein